MLLITSAIDHVEIVPINNKLLFSLLKLIDSLLLYFAASEVFEEIHSKINRKMFKRYIQKIVDMHTEEDCFDSLIAFLFASVEVSICLKHFNRDCWFCKGPKPFDGN